MSTSSSVDPKHASEQMKPLYLIDVMGIVFRSYYALPSLTRRDGTPIGALFGVCSMIIKLVTERDIGGLIAVFDSPGPTFRKKMYDLYKANRGDPPEDLVPQFEFVKRAMDAFSVPSIAQSGYEADDIIASIVAQRASDLPVFIVSTDKDLMQLVTENVFVYDAYKQIRYDPTAVLEKYGVSPNKMRDWLALVGDASDNIPGVAGVGPKTASKLLAAHGSIEGIRDAIPEMKASKMKEKLAAAGESLDLSRKLVTLAEDCTVTNVISGTYGGWDQELILPFCEEFELRRLKRRVISASGSSKSGQRSASSTARQIHGSMEASLSTGKPSAPTKAGGAGFDDKGGESLSAQHDIARTTKSSMSISMPSANPVHLHSPSTIAEWIGSATYPVALCAADVPTTEQPISSPIYCLADTGGRLAVVSVDGVEVVDLLPEILLGLAETTTNNSSGSLIVHDVKALLGRASSFSELAALQLSVHDTMLAAYLLLSDRHAMSLVWVLEHVFQITPDERSEEVISIANNIPFLPHEQRDNSPEPPESSQPQSSTQQIAVAEALFAAYCQLPLWRRLSEDLESAALSGLYSRVELPLAQVLSKLERQGCMVDQSLLEILGRELSTEIDAISEEIQNAAVAAKRLSKSRNSEDVDSPVQLNINSPKQLAVLLFDDIGLTPMKKTKTGYSTDSEVLEQLALVHPLPKKILRYRMLAKLKSTYVDQLQSLVSPKDGRVHGRFNQAVAATGRLSSSDPNLQNIPIRSKLGQRIRRAFTAPTGWRIIAADYSQVELRVLAHLSRDPELISAFRDGEDIHTRTARQIFGSAGSTAGLSGTENTNDGETDLREQRRVAKAVNFGVVYGQGDWGLAKQLGIPRKAAKQYITQYFDHFSGVASYMQNLIVEAKELGQVTTLFGRRRRLPDINSSNARKRDAAERIARNTPIQGTAADIIKLAMLSVAQWIGLHGQVNGKNTIHMILSVHDELVFEVRDDVAAEYAAHIKSLMEQVCELDVPLVVDIGMGQNWGDAH